MESHRHCPLCGWPDAQVYEVVSRHRTTEGVIVYSRCVCGRLQVRRGDRVAIRQTGPVLPTIGATGHGTPDGVDARPTDSRTSRVPARSATSLAACLVGLVSVLGGLLVALDPTSVVLVPLLAALGGLAGWVLSGSDDEDQGAAHVGGFPIRGQEVDSQRCRS